MTKDRGRMRADITDAGLELLQCVVSVPHRSLYPYDAKNSITKDSNKSLLQQPQAINDHPLAVATFVMWPGEIAVPLPP